MSDRPPVGAEDPMPVFVIKAKDNLAPEAVRFYRELCWRYGLREQGDQVDAALREIELWRATHFDECKWPDHRHVPAGEPGSGSEVRDDGETMERMAEAMRDEADARGSATTFGDLAHAALTAARGGEQ